MSRANLSMFEADLSASWLNLQRILNFYPLRNLTSNELFLLCLHRSENKCQKEKTATVIYADANGYFSFVPVHKGYWGFAALGAGGEMKHNGKELSQDAVLWIEAK